MEKEKQEPKITSDEDWKQQAKREKDQLDEQQQAARQQAPTADPPSAKSDPQKTRQLPPADFNAHISSLVIQALYCLGKIQDPGGKNPPLDLDLAKHHIDVLQMLEEKTKDNLTEEEQKLLASSLHEVRMHYVGAAKI
ncbi:MAG: DUF1844 domain-containing protein [Planctomycetes bacterium]|nr:DUF1844 domain-containing protein [Planctomycetota bacterium]